MKINRINASKSIQIRFINRIVNLILNNGKTKNILNSLTIICFGQKQ